MGRSHLGFDEIDLRSSARASRISPRISLSCGIASYVRKKDCFMQRCERRDRFEILFEMNLALGIDCTSSLSPRTTV